MKVIPIGYLEVQTLLKLAPTPAASNKATYNIKNMNQKCRLWVVELLNAH